MKNNNLKYIDINLKIVPNASKNAIVGIENGALKVRISAPPVDGKANKELVAFLSTVCKIPKKSFMLLSGQTTRRKKIRIEGMSYNEFLKKIL